MIGCTGYIKEYCEEREDHSAPYCCVHLALAGWPQIDEEESISFLWPPCCFLFLFIIAFFCCCCFLFLLLLFVAFFCCCLLLSSFFCCCCCCSFFFFLCCCCCFLLFFVAFFCWRRRFRYFARLSLRSFLPPQVTKKVQYQRTNKSSVNSINHG